MSAREKAMEVRDMGCNCAQSVLLGCGEYTGLTEHQALTVSAGFGAGLGSGEICGAISGAVMAVGSCLPYEGCTDTAAKARAKECAAQICSVFKEQFGCVTCAELKAKELSCDMLIEYAAELAEEMINNIK